MRSKLTCIVLLVSTTSLLAQKNQTLPPGFDAKEAPLLQSGYSAFFGGYKDGRCQVAMSGLGSKTLVVTSLGLRRDGQAFLLGSAGRKFALTLAVGETNSKTMSTTFANNPIGKTNVVFSGVASWPTQARPTRQPQPWNVKGLTFPFSKAYLYSGKNDLLTDWTFAGGKLANGAPWGASALNAYYLDGVTKSTSDGFAIASAGVANCYDSNAPSALGTATYFWQRSFAKDTGSTTTSDKMQMFFQVTDAARSTAHIQAVSLGGVITTKVGTGALPANIGACNPLMVDMSKLLGFNFFTTNASGAWQTPSNTYLPYPKWAFAVGLNVFTQVAWTETKSKSFRLSRVGRTTIRKQPQATSWRGYLLFQSGTAPKTGIGASVFVPLQRVSHK